jgi:SAM-dependent methyltransferase
MDVRMQTSKQPSSSSQLPPCPLTGRPAKRRVHGFATGPLLAVWRVAGAGDLSRLFGDTPQVVLYESDTGLFFFDPMTEGDEGFYKTFYRRSRAYARLDRRMISRVEFRHAAALIPAGANVVDVGCGMGAFSAHVGHASYVGLEPFAPNGAPDVVLRETLEQHVERKAGRYDVVTAFQVIEHVVDPKGFARKCMDLLRPGGMLILCAPLHPSPLTEVPNFPLNFPPHHLTWWSRSAFTELATILDVELIEITELPFSPHLSIVGWLRRFSRVRLPPAPRERYFAHRWSWHANLAFAYALANIADRVLPPPGSLQPIDVLMAARKRT